MNTRHIGIKELRQNLFKVANRLERSQEQYLVFRNNKPAFLLQSVDKKAPYLENLITSVKRGRADVKKGKLYTPAQVRKTLGL